VARGAPKLVLFDRHYVLSTKRLFESFMNCHPDVF